MLSLEQNKKIGNYAIYNINAEQEDKKKKDKYTKPSNTDTKVKIKILNDDKDVSQGNIRIPLKKDIENPKQIDATNDSTIQGVAKQNKTIYQAINSEYNIIEKKEEKRKQKKDVITPSITQFSQTSTINPPKTDLKPYVVMMDKKDKKDKDVIKTKIVFNLEEDNMFIKRKT